MHITPTPGIASAYHWRDFLCIAHVQKSTASTLYNIERSRKYNTISHLAPSSKSSQRTWGIMKVLCVAEKPSIAKSITEILSGGRWDTVSLLFLHLTLLPSLQCFLCSATYPGHELMITAGLWSQICTELRLQLQPTSSTWSSRILRFYSNSCIRTSHILGKLTCSG